MKKLFYDESNGLWYYTTKSKTPKQICNLEIRTSPIIGVFLRQSNVMIEKPSENEVFPDGEFIMDHFDLILIFNYNVSFGRM